MKTKISSRLTILISTFTMALFPVPASAVAGAFDEDFFSSNRILYFMPGGETCTQTGYSTPMDLPVLVGSTNKEKIWNFLIDPKYGGLSKEQAAGVMGNIERESGYEPGKKEAVPSYAGEGFGIIQWTGDSEGDRRYNLEKEANDRGVDVSNLAFQLAYLLYEVKDWPVGGFSKTNGRWKDSFGSESDLLWDTLKKQTTVDDAMILFHDSFEKSADTYDMMTKGPYSRKTYADAVYAEFAGGTGATSGAGSTTSNSSGCSSSFTGGDLIQTLLEFAWPEYHEMSRGPVDPAPKPAYQEVVKKLQSEGKWVGGGNLSSADLGVPAGNDDNAGYGGIDCGGFVSILLTQSGFEPNYNYGLGEGSGSVGTQRAWAEEHWTRLGKGGEPGFDADKLLPGDVAYKDGDGHTFVYVGPIDGFESKYASASYGGYPYLDVASWRSPMSASPTAETAALSDYTWYGKR